MQRLALVVFLVAIQSGSSASRLETMVGSRVVAALRLSGTTIVNSYVRNLEQRPVATKCITSGFISAAADLTCQTLENKKKKLDLSRFAKFTLLGTILIGPTLHYWYGFLARKIPGNTVYSIMQRLALDQLFFTPCFITVFMSAVLMLDGRPENIPAKLSSDFGRTLMTNYSVWVPAMFLNFKYIPPQFQVLFSNGVGYLWNVYLSYASYKSVNEKSPIRIEKE